VITHDRVNYDFKLGRTSEVGAYPANAWGLHDVHGNVLEWVEDDWHENYRGAPTDGSVWKDAGERQDQRVCVLRGGAASNDSRNCRSACRFRGSAVNRVNVFGFRVARTLF
jgi:formylglycine-generating enzyme required for sulfatase activity